jgi:electron transport complex protein RnfC
MTSTKQGLSFGLSPKTDKAIKPLHYVAISPLSFISLKQHKGAMATSLVSKGQKVEKGQVIARSTHPDSADIHSPSPGVVKNISTKKELGKGLVTYIEIETGGFYKADNLKKELTIGHLSRDSILKSIKKAGLVETGRANPLPLFSILQKNSTSHLVINAMTDEPFTALNRTLLKYQHQELAKGVALVSHLLNPQNIVIAINEKFKNDALALQTSLQEEGLKTNFMLGNGLATDGNPYIITERLTLKESNLEDNLVESPVAILGLNSLYLIYRAIFYNESHIEHSVSVAGGGVKEKKVIVAHIGTPVGFLLEECGGIKSKKAFSIVAGSLLTGFNLIDEETPLTKEIEQIVVLTKKETGRASSTECTMCNLCVKACPRGLYAHKIYQMLVNHHYHLIEQLQFNRCLLCGACSYICPSRLPLSTLFAQHQSPRESQKEEDK